MKNILHINTWDSGGAAAAAKRLYAAQRQRNQSVDFLALWPSSGKAKPHISYYEDYLAKRYGRIYARCLRAANRAFNQIPNRFDKNAFFNRPQSLFRLERHPLVQKADIIHLHAVSKFIDFPSFFPALGKPIVWTLHDMHPFSGGKHYDSMMPTKFADLEKKYKQIKKAAYAGKDIRVVAPSQWLFEASQNSELLGAFPHYHIPYCINTDFIRFRKTKPQKTNPNRILFVAENTTDKRKGMHLLLEALPQLPPHLDIVVVGNADKSIWTPYPNVQAMGYVEGAEALAKVYSEADLHVMPSLEDNLPNTIIESHACGTPVVGFNTSGIAQMIQDGKTGVLVEEQTGAALAEGIKSALRMLAQGQLQADHIADWCANYYDTEKVVRAYDKVYEKGAPNP